MELLLIHYMCMHVLCITVEIDLYPIALQVNYSHINIFIFVVLWFPKIFTVKINCPCARQCAN